MKVKKEGRVGKGAAKGKGKAGGRMIKQESSDGGKMEFNLLQSELGPTPTGAMQGGENFGHQVRLLTRAC